MKKLNKAFAVLTVLAMLATLFVAIPTSATSYTGLTPEVDLIFTSGNTPDSTVVDPSSVAVGTVFYAWVHYSGLTSGAYVLMSDNFTTYDSTVEKPYNPKKNAAATNNATAKNSFVAADLVMYSEDDMEGYYQSGAAADFANNNLSCMIMTHASLQTAINGGECDEMDNYTDDTYYQIDASGEFVSHGFAFIKTAAGPSGVTIAGNDKELNGKDVWYPASQLPDAACVILVDHPTSYREVDGATQTVYDYTGIGSVAGKITDNSPVDSASTPTDEPTEAPTDEPTEAPTEAPTEVPEAEGEVTGTKQASKSDKAFNQNAFFYEFETPTIPGEVTGLTATFQIPGKDAVQGDVTNVNLTGISNVALNIAAVIKNIPAGQEDTPVTTTYTLTYSVGGVEKTLQWSRTNSLN